MTPYYDDGTCTIYHDVVHCDVCGRRVWVWDNSNCGRVSGE